MARPYSRRARRTSGISAFSAPGPVSGRSLCGPFNLFGPFYL